VLKGHSALRIHFHFHEVGILTPFYSGKCASPDITLSDFQIDQAEPVGRLLMIFNVHSSRSGRSFQNADPEGYVFIGQQIAGIVARHSLVLEGFGGLGIYAHHDEEKNGNYYSFHFCSV